MSLVPVSDRQFMRRTAEPRFEYAGPRTLEEMRALYKGSRRRLDAPGLLRLANKRAEEERRAREKAARKIVSRGASEATRVSSPRMRAIVLVVAAHFDVTPLDIVSQRRFGKIVFARHVAMYLARHETPLSSPTIGRNLGGRDHSTVLHGVAKIERMVNADPVLAATIQMLREDLSAPR